MRSECTELQERIVAEGTTPALPHLAHCDVCRAFVAALQEIDVGLGGLPELGAPPHAVLHTIEALARAPRAPVRALPIARRRRLLPSRVRWPIAAAAVVLAFISGRYVGFEDTAAPAVDGPDTLSGIGTPDGTILADPGGSGSPLVVLPRPHDPDSARLNRARTRVSARIPDEALHAVLERGVRGVATCVWAEDFQRREIGVTLEILPSGRLSTVRFDGALTDGMKECMTEKLIDLRFRPHSGPDPMVVTFPMLFNRANE